LQLLGKTPPKGLAAWDGPALAEELDVPVDAVWKILRNEGIYFVSELAFPWGPEVQASFWGLTEGARRATGVSPHRPLWLDTLSVLAYEKTGGMQYEHIRRKRGP
ncbi:MAG: hypothetical protein KAU38_08935, partial [Desulfobacterales bacterium]|nr:hypothetical protein [Desulfobacterales bacterium]